MVPHGNEDCSNMVPNSNVMHTNMRRSNWKKGRHQKDTTLSLNDDNNSSTTTIKDHSNESDTTNKS